MKITRQWQFEDEFIECFTNGITDEIANSGSYMTVLDFDKACATFNKVKDKYNKDLPEILEELRNSHLPMVKLLGKYLTRLNKEA